MTRHLSTAAVLLLAACAAWADDLPPLPDITDTRCPEGPGVWAPGLGLEAPKDGTKNGSIGQDFLGLCRQKNKGRMPGFPGGAPTDGLTGIVSSDPVERAKELQRQAEEYSRAAAIGKKVGSIANPWGDKAEPAPAPAPSAGAELFSPTTALPAPKFQKVPLNSVPALPQRFQVDQRPVPAPAPAATPKAGLKGKICEDLPQFISPKVTWCRPDTGAPQ